MVAWAVSKGAHCIISFLTLYIIPVKGNQWGPAIKVEVVTAKDGRRDVEQLLNVIEDSGGLLESKGSVTEELSTVSVTKPKILYVKDW